MRAKHALLLMLVLLTTGCASSALKPRIREPAVVPPGWTADYDYASGMSRYLRQQFNDAIVEGATAYVYIYSDRSERCRTLRRLMSRNFESPLFSEVRISMLDFGTLHELHKRYPEVAFDPGYSSGVFVKIASDGNLSAPMFYASLYLHAPHALPRFGYPDPGRSTPRDFIAELRRFFAQNADD